MTRFSLIALLLAATALPAFGQANEFGIVLGASRRFVDDAPKDSPDAFLDSDLSLENSAVTLFYAAEMGPETWLRVSGGRMETQVGVVTGQLDGEDIRRDVQGEVQFVDLIAEYRFSEVFGSTSLYGGAGVYRHDGEEIDASTDWGLVAGLNADFPMSRRYGFLLDAAYHFTQADFGPRYLTVGAGLRVSF